MNLQARHRLPPVDVTDDVWSRVRLALAKLSELHAVGAFPHGPWTLSGVIRVAIAFGLERIETDIEKAQKVAEEMRAHGPARATAYFDSFRPSRSRQLSLEDAGFRAMTSSVRVGGTKPSEPTPPRPKGRQVGGGRKKR